MPFSVAVSDASGALTPDAAVALLGDGTRIAIRRTPFDASRAGVTFSEPRDRVPHSRLRRSDPPSENRSAGSAQDRVRTHARRPVVVALAEAYTDNDDTKSVADDRVGFRRET